MNKQIKITVSEEALRVVENKAKELGMVKATYCYNIIFEHIRNELEVDKK